MSLTNRKKKTVILPNEMVEWLEEYSKKTGLPISRLVERLVGDFIEEEILKELEEVVEKEKDNNNYAIELLEKMRRIIKDSGKYVFESVLAREQKATEKELECFVNDYIRDFYANEKLSEEILKAIIEEVTEQTIDDLKGDDYFEN